MCYGLIAGILVRQTGLLQVPTSFSAGSLQASADVCRPVVGVLSIFKLKTILTWVSRIDLRHDFFLPILSILFCVLFDTFVCCYIGKIMKNKMNKLIQ